MNRTISDSRITPTAEAVLTSLLGNPQHAFSAVDLGRLARIPTGAVHPILAMLEAVGWIESWWESVDPAVDGRLPRRRYRLTADGVRMSRMSIARAHRAPVAGRAWPSPAVGCTA